MVGLFLFSRKVPTFRFDQFSTLSWMFSTFLGSTGVIVHKYSMSFETIMLVIISHTFMVGAFLVSHNEIPDKPRPLRFDQISFNIITYLPLMFILAAIIRSVVEGNIPIWSVSYNIEVNRAEHWAHEKAV